jgi:anhydro-N-acetylmuramic acid kinase
MYDSGLQNGLSSDDILANVTRLVAWSMACSYVQLKQAQPQVLAGEVEVILCGGGAFNPTLRAFLQEEIAVQVGATWLVHALDELEGSVCSSEAREAIAFALMACAAVCGEENTLPQVTGARRACSAGQIARP